MAQLTENMKYEFPEELWDIIILNLLVYITLGLIGLNLTKLALKQFTTIIKMNIIDI